MTTLGLGVPPAARGVCTLCHGPVRGGGQCWCCRRVGAVLGEDHVAAPPVVPVALCRPGDQLHGALRRYKDAPAQSARQHYSSLLGRLLDRHVGAHLRCLHSAVGWWDALALVPSTGRGGVACASPCPLGAVVVAAPALERLPRVQLWRGRGSATHLHPAPDAFAVPDPASGRRVILLEDAWVTGSRARSAVAALSSAGVEVAAVLVIGRVVDPDASPWVARWWERLRVEGPRPTGACCLVGCSGDVG